MPLYRKTENCLLLEIFDYLKICLGYIEFRNGLKVLVVLIGLFPSLFTSAQSVTILPPPINPLDCVSALELYTGTLINNSDEPLHVFLQGQVSYGFCGGALDLLAEGSTADFIIPAGNLVVTVQNAESLFAPINYSFFNNNLEQSYFNTGCLVPGCYEICVQIIEYESPALPNVLGELCYNIEIQSGTPLILTSPFNESTLTNSYPLFSWTPVLPRINGAAYRLTLVEKIGFQSAYQALLANPPYYSEAGLFNNVQMYPAAARPLEPCREYVWSVTYEGMTGFPIQESEVWVFRTECEEDIGFIKNKKDSNKEIDKGERVYYGLLRKDAGNYNPVIDGILRFQLDNSYRLIDKLSYQIIDSRGEEVETDILALNENDTRESKSKKSTTIVQTGKNQFVIDLRSSKIKDDKFYTLIVNDSKNNFYLRFITVNGQDGT